ncbi:MAG: restriction endonuclease subunit S [Blastocatellia bacterium]
MNYCLNTSGAREFCQRIKSDGVSQSNINAQKLGTFEVPFCSIEEQKEIVRRVNTLFNLVDQIEARYKRVKPLVDKLPQSILAKTFRGGLVPTEAELARREGRDYEPASVLLERVRSERAENAQGRKEKAGSRQKPTTKRDVDELWRSSA